VADGAALESPWLFQSAVEKGFHSKAKHIETVAVKEVFQGQTAWEGKVEVFKLIGHPKAKLAYGWGFKKGKKAEFATVLGIPPVTNPQSAIKIYIASQNK